MRIRKALCAALAAVFISGGTAAFTHAYDALTAAQNANLAQVRDYNNGWLDATCASGNAWAITAYGAHCK